MKQTKVIKRYANRKLYDTERSCYVTLEEISNMIKEGEDVRVVDNKTKDDLTAITLAQIIVEEEKKVAKMPLKLLKSIIQSGNEALGDFYADHVVDPVKRLRDDVERRVDGLLKRDAREGGEEQAPADAAADAQDAAAKQNVIQEFVSSSVEAFESWQRRIDERVRETMQKAGARPDVESLRSRVESLEARLRELEARKQP
jgi:polyhydroxyalkanoate synthesis repressor PhaR